MRDRRKGKRKSEIEKAVRSYGRYRTGIILLENRKKLEPQKGIRQTVIDTYHEKGILEAYKVINAYNNSIGREAYTREIFESWIAEEQRKEGNKKDGFDR